MLQKNQTIQLKKDRYALIELIGEGGQGVIWRVKAESTGKEYVLKTTRTHEHSAAGRLQPLDSQVLDELNRRMQEEIDFFLALQQNNVDSQACFIACCLDHGLIQYKHIELPSMIMPHYPHSLQQQVPYSLEQGLDYDLHTLLNWLIQLSQALQCTHEQIIDGHAYMHRDIKPANVLLTQHKEVRLIDFGIAKQQSDESGTTSIAHAPAWAAPEQILPESLLDNGDNVFRLTEKTDLYSLGLLAYYLATGGAQPKAQTELKYRSQAIHSQHIVLLGQGKKGKLGQVGEINQKDRDYLQQQLLNLFFANTEVKTRASHAINPLPISSALSEQMVVLIQRCLSPQADKRPTANAAKQQFQALQHGLKPRLGQLSLACVNKDLIIGETVELVLQLQGKGLMQPFEWLQIYINDQRLDEFNIASIQPALAQGTAFLAEKTQLSIQLNAFKTVGKHAIRIIAAVGEKSHQAGTHCKVGASAQQLWQQGQHQAALSKQLRPEWLDQLEQTAQTSLKARSYYSQLLENLQRTVSDAKQLEDLTQRFQRAEIIEPKPTINWKLAALLVSSVVLGAGAFIGLYKNDNVIQSVLVSSTTEGNDTVPSNISPIPLLAQESSSKALTNHTEIQPQTPTEAKLFEFEPEMVEIPAGSFQMGCISNDKACQDGEKPVHKVNIESFYMAKTEVTFAQWNACKTAGGCSYRPYDQGWGRGQRPVINISWDDSQEYIKWLNQQTAKNYRLPTEAEWEYAARAGTTTKYSWGNQAPSCSKKAKNGASHNGGKDSGCYYKPKGEDRGTEMVASYHPNPWGLYDMHGNVWEWTCSAYTEKYEKAGLENKCINNNDSQSYRMLRGGSWYADLGRLRSAYRDFNHHYNWHGNDSGFRLVRTR